MTDGVSLLEQLVLQLGSVEMDGTGLELVIDGEVRRANKITLRIASKNAAAEPPQEQSEQEEWEWQIALARARLRAAESAVPLELIRQGVHQLQRAKRPRRVALGTSPPVPGDDDVTRKIEIQPAPLRSPEGPRLPPPLPPPPDED